MLAEWLRREDGITAFFHDVVPGSGTTSRCRHDVVVLDGDRLPSTSSRASLVLPTVVLARPGQLLPVLSLLRIGVRGIVTMDSGVAKTLVAAVRVAASGHVFVHHDAVDRLWESAVPPSGSGTSDDALLCLTGRERQVWRLLSTGRSNRQIARALDVSERTVRFHLTNVFHKLDVRSRGEAIGLAYRLGES